MSYPEDVAAREPREQYLWASDVMRWIDMSPFLFYGKVKRGEFEKNMKFGKTRAKYSKDQIKVEMGWV